MYLLINYFVKIYVKVFLQHSQNNSTVLQYRIMDRWFSFPDLFLIRMFHKKFHNIEDMYETLI